MPNEIYEHNAIVFEWTYTKNGQTFCRGLSEDGKLVPIGERKVYRVKTTKQLRAIIAFLRRDMPGGHVSHRNLADYRHSGRLIAGRYPNG